MTLSLSTGKSIYHPPLTSTKMAPPAAGKPCPGTNDQEVGIDKKPYSTPNPPFRRWIIHLFFILVAPPVPAAIFCLTVSPLPFRGLPVPFLRFPVNSLPS
jgi:hypothetical protein